MKKIIMVSFLGVLFLLFLLLVSFSDFFIDTQELSMMEPVNVIELGDAWATNTVNTVIFRHHGIITEETGYQFASFYEDENFICFVKRNIETNEVHTSKLSGDYDVYDAHNSISIGIDREGFLHVSYDHHGDKLRYRRSSKPLSIDEWTDKISMTEKKEERVTYPAFMQSVENNKRGPLLFLYREGSSRDGDAFINIYNEESQEWVNREKPVLKGTDQSPWSCGPYWSHPVMDEDGGIHLFFTWRTEPLGDNRLINNIDIHYAFSDNLGLTWQTSLGREYYLPITPVNSETVFAVSPGSNLINQTSAAVDASNYPHMVFYSNDPDGIPQYQHLWFNGKEWKHNYISARQEPFSLEGRGTLQLPISRPEILIDDNDFVYIIYRGDLTEDHMAIQRLQPPDYEPPGETRVLWYKPLDYAEPVLDRMRWDNEGVLTMLIQKNYQPPHDQYTATRQEPIYLIDWNITSEWD